MNSLPQQQLTLPVSLRDDATLDNFLPVPGSEALLGALGQQLEEGGEAIIYLHGGIGSGKSHLLQACCHRAGGGALYLPLADLVGYGPGEVLADVADMRLICLDDLDAVAGMPAWELALFELYNRARETGARLLVAAASAPRVIALDLEDLRSRLSWGVVYRLASCDDEQKKAVLQFRARRRGLTLPDEVASYLVSRAPRGLDPLLGLLDLLDQASLEHKRALSIPFVKQVLKL
jgi:DnaA-homolog protein